MMRVGIDAHKRSCTTLVFADSEETPVQSFDFKTTRAEVLAMLEKIPEKSVFVIESSTTGKAITKMISSFGSTKNHVVHMVAPPERKASVKTDKRDCERIVKEDALGYLRRCYVPSPEIEDMRFLVTNQIEIGAKISRVKNQIQALLERNMVQSEFEEFSSIFGIGGLQKLGEIDLPKQDKLALALHLEELKFYATQHTEVETEIAKMAEADQDCQLLFSHPGISAFTALAIKARIGDASRFPTKKHLCSYAGVVPGADNSGERESRHEHVKHGDVVLKYALTIAVRAAAQAKKESDVKRIYMRQIKRGKAPQEAQVDAARKLACIVWKILTSKQRYVEEDKYLTARKVKQTSYNAKRVIKDAVLPEDVPELAKRLSSDVEVLEQYSTNLDRMLGRHNRGRKKPSDRSDLK
ncbi:MAG: IS110 family transposase [Nitrososphaerota archaeon]|nr:IS110 family transposase [Nitrososphaerota archaeon]